MSRDKVWVVLVAGGSGSRFGGAKQLSPLFGRRVIDWSFEVASSVADGVIVVHPFGEGARYPGELRTDGGPTRSASVRAGLRLVPSTAEAVLIHDAARPLATGGLYTKVVSRLKESQDAVVPVVELKESLKLVDSDRVCASVDRSMYRLAQTPQGFRYDLLLEAYSGDFDETDDVALVERLGVRAATVDGEFTNLKITYPSDLVFAEAILASRTSG